MSLFAPVFVAAVAFASAAAEPNAPAPEPNAAGPTSAPAMLPYTDAAFGYELQLPAGWAYDRARFQQYKGSIGLLRGRGPRGERALQIQLFRIEPDVRPATETQPAEVRTRTFSDWAVDFSTALADNGDAVPLKPGEPLVQGEAWNLPPRSGTLLTYQSRVGPRVVRTFTVCIPFDPNTVWVMEYTGLAGHDEQVAALRAELEQIATTLKIHYNPIEVQDLVAAFERGRAVIDRVRDSGAKARFDETEYYYNLTLAGKPIGYLRRRLSREDHTFTPPGAKHADTRSGLRVRERAWRFADDGTVRYTRLDMFSTFDRQDELLENQSIQMPAPDVQPQQTVSRMDQVIRKKDTLYSSLTSSLDRALPEPGKPQNVGPAYLDLGWMRLAAGLLLAPGTPSAPHAFATYDTETRSIASQTITPLGEKPLPGGNPKDLSGPVFAFEMREGLHSQPTLLYTDARGTALRLVAGELTIERVSKPEIERLYAARRDEAAKRFNVRED